MTYKIIQMGIYRVVETNRITTIWFKGYDINATRSYQMVYGRDRRDRRFWEKTPDRLPYNIIK